MAKKKKTDDEPKAEYTVLARRYRPQQLGDLIGQEHVASALTNALTSGRIAHAYLFTGARGTGKTSTARILAKCLNCDKGPTATPCDECENCKRIMSGDDVDAIEIDAASNNKVDQIRELRQNVGFRPTRARFKIYIIDEVHMLASSSGSFNALLKTLEEPPAHVKFILATTEVQKIPITILSRCQRYDFAHVRPQKIFEQLKRIVASEGVQADDESLHIVARRAAGSMRDSQSLLDQLLAFADGSLTAEKVHALLGTAGDDRVMELADLILKRDAKGAVEKLQQYSERGLQMGELIDQLIDYWRGLMLVLAAGPEFGDLPGMPSYQESLKKHAKGTTLDTVLAGLDVLTTTKSRTRGSPHVSTLLEMAVVRLSRLDELVSVSSLLNGIPVPVKPTVLAEDSSKKNSPLNNSDTNVSRPATFNFSDPQVIADFVKTELGPVKGSQFSQAGVPAILGPNSLAFRFAGRYSSAYEHCADERTVSAVQEALRKVSGRDWIVKIELDAAAQPQEAKPTPVATASNRQKDLMTLPLFAKVASVFGAQLVKLDDGFQPIAHGGTEEQNEPDA